MVHMQYREGTLESSLDRCSSGVLSTHFMVDLPIAFIRVCLPHLLLEIAFRCEIVNMTLLDLENYLAQVVWTHVSKNSS